jgi:hypothetical protein
MVLVLFLKLSEFVTGTPVKVQPVFYANTRFRKPGVDTDDDYLRIKTRMYGMSKESCVYKRQLVIYIAYIYRLLILDVSDK